MRCPYCGEDHDKVIDSRSTDGGRAVRRRRECLRCHKRFTTYEYVETTTRLWVIKKDGSRVPYDRQKVLAGVEKACYKRPVSAGAIQRLVEEVEEELFKRGEREVEAAAIGGAIAERLKALDRVAYVRFASVYKRFRDLDDLLEEVKDVLESGEKDMPEQGKLF
jgi:transcriptional repressor NrdR